MANGLKFSPRKTALALAVAVVCAWQSPVFAHGSEAHILHRQTNHYSRRGGHIRTLCRA
ncbi:hypothetical protein M2D46_18340 [Klebsiella pneumoniae]|nr:hypothetical protein [Klebsiella pneumoniae]